MLELEKKLSKFGSKPGLTRIRKLMKKLGNPQNKLKVILVTGTNGKGSVTSYLASILKQAGYKVGSYFSPHLKKSNERFRINGKEISDRKLRKYEKEILALFEKGYEMTEFEALTAIAYKYFAEEKCDYAVMEIGMGGRLDATNIANEEIAIVTNIGKEHTEWLGKKEEQIAYEKIGILKTGIGITGAEGNALKKIKKEARKRKKKLLVMNEDFFVNNIIANEKETKFDYCGKGKYEKLKVRLLGKYQANNAALAIRAAEELGINERIIRKGLEKANIVGRLQVIGKNPIILLDAAHNPHGIKELVKNLALFRYKRLICVFGVMKDKDWKEMLKILAPKCNLMIINQAKTERAANAKEIAKEARRYTNAIVENDVKRSFSLAKKHANKRDLLLICGSIYMLGEIL